jgi:eukaryotic-like serine/threonine-protein kinase
MAVAPRLAPGSVFARDYQVIDLLAEGGMGAVYRAEQQSTRKLRALKLVSTRLAADPKGRQRFVREATIGASIDSEHVVEVIGAGIDEESDRPWLAMELLDGADLGAVVRHQGPLSPAQLHEVAGQLCHGLAAAHRAGVVHRDLKPANVFIARSRRAGVPFTLKILDFGIAKVVQESGSGSSETDTVGSPLWMAPEQLNAQRPTPATDVWALGLLAFWALTGKHYWFAAHAESSTVQALFVEQLFKPLDPPSQRAMELGATAVVPPGFDEWFLRCTQREPTRRFADAGAAGEALRALLPADPEAAAHLLPAGSLPPSTGDTLRRPGGTSEVTLTATPSNWEASAVVPASALAAARSTLEGDATHTDSPSLGADLSRAPLPGTSSARTTGRGPSPLVVALSVAMLVGLLLGGGYLVWRWQTDDTTDATLADADADALAEREPRASTGDDAANDATSDDTGSSAPVADTPVEPHLQLVVPLRTQLDHEAHDLGFLGWSEAGHRFVLQAEYREDRQDKGAHAANRLTLVQVHDALTGVMVESFVVDRQAGGSWARYHRLGRAAADAQPHAQWPAVRDALRLRKGAPQRDAPGEGGQLRITADEAPSGTHMSFPPSTLGAAFRWSIDPAIAATEPDRQGPEVTLSLARGEALWTLAKLEPPFGSQRLMAGYAPGGEEPALVGRIMAYWSPDGTRVLLLFEADARPTGEPPLGYRRWLLRAVGPQIRLVDAGAGQRRVRELAAGLATAGLPVAIAELRAPPEAESRLSYAQGKDQAAAVAERVRAVLPWPLVPAAKRFKRDFVEVVVILGHDAG